MGWGSNNECQLGIDPPSDPLITNIVCTDHPTPVQITLSGNVSTQGHTIAAARGMTVVVLSDGSVIGLGGHGDLPSTNYRGMCNPDLGLMPAPLYTGSGAEVAGSARHILVRTRDGEVWSLGANNAGQLGRGSASVQECPQQLATTAVRGVSQVAAGDEHSLVLVEGILTTSPTTVNFGDHLVGVSSTPPTRVTVTNTGLAPLAIYGLSLSGLGDFTSADTCPDQPATLAAGAACEISLVFTPVSADARSAQISFTHDGRGRGQGEQLSLTGRGVVGSISFTPATINFGNVPTGSTSASQFVTVTNNGTVALPITGISTTVGFAILSNTCPTGSLAIGATCRVEVSFNPTAAGNTVGELRVAYGVSQTATMPLSGRGT